MQFSPSISFLSTHIFTIQEFDYRLFYNKYQYNFNLPSKMITETAIEYAIELIKEGQGFYSNVYKDTQNYWTIGFGHKLLKHQIGKLKTITVEKAQEMLQNEVQTAIGQAKNYWKDHLNSMNAERTAVILDMTYNLGSVRWPKFTKAIHQRKWKVAASQILDSKYARQVKNRARRNAAIIRDGRRHSKSQFQ